MIKRMLGILAAVGLTMNSAAASVVENGKITCFPLAHGENGMGSQASVVVPPFFLRGSSLVELFVKNIGSDGVNVNLKLFDEDGNQWVPAQTPLYRGHFDIANSPIRELDGSGAALLKSFETGFMQLDDDSELKIVSGVLTWQANKCLEKAMLSVDMSVYRFFKGSPTRDHSRSVTINGGNPF